MTATPAQLLRTPLGNATKQARAEGLDPATYGPVIEARRNLRNAKIQQAIESWVNDDPPLTPAERDMFATLLRGAA